MIPLLGATIVDVTIVLAAALTVNTILRRRSAALRHAMLAAALARARTVSADHIQAALPEVT